MLEQRQFHEESDGAEQDQQEQNPAQRTVSSLIACVDGYCALGHDEHQSTMKLRRIGPPPVMSVTGTFWFAGVRGFRTAFGSPWFPDLADHRPYGYWRA